MNEEGGVMGYRNLSSDRRLAEAEAEKRYASQPKDAADAIAMDEHHKQLAEAGFLFCVCCNFILKKFA